jgi:putative acetyltransferase
MTTIRPERPGDTAAIRQIVEEAFSTKSFSDGSEGAIIDALRNDGDLTLSLVAEEAGEVVGHVAFSPVRIGADHGGWFGLGPIAVRPDQQRQGIGSRLIRSGLEVLNEQGAAGVVLIGDPAYYTRFGFANDGLVSYLDVPMANVFHLILNGPARQGAITYAPALHGA